MKTAELTFTVLKERASRSPLKVEFLEGPPQPSDLNFITRLFGKYGGESETDRQARIAKELRVVLVNEKRATWEAGMDKIRVEVKFEPGQYMVCSESELQQYTFTGWVLVDSFVVQGAETVSVQEPVMNTCNGSSYASLQNGTRAVEVQQLKFLLRKSVNAVQQELLDRASAADQIRFETERQLEELRKQSATQDKQLKTVETDLLDALKTAEQRYDKNTSLTSKMLLLEKHLAKVRESIGSKAYEAIVADEQQQAKPSPR